MKIPGGTNDELDPRNYRAPSGALFYFDRRMPFALSEIAKCETQESGSNPLGFALMALLKCGETVLAGRHENGMIKPQSADFFSHFCHIGNIPLARLWDSVYSFAYLEGRVQLSSSEVHNLRGSIVTPLGERIPMKVSLLPARAGGQYTHIGQVEIPVAWIDEFEENISHFHFWSEDGECFNQIQVLDEVATTDGDASKKGRIILLRDRRASAALRGDLPQRDDAAPLMPPPPLQR